LFVTVFAIHCYPDKSCQPTHPDTCICPQIKSCTMTNFWLRDSLYPRFSGASAHLQTFCYRDNLSATYQLCTATLVMLNTICTRTAKTRAIPSLHRDSFLAKVPGFCPVLASGNTTSLYCRAVIVHSKLVTDPKLTQTNAL
jgi:hypothetical protein